MSYKFISEIILRESSIVSGCLVAVKLCQTKLKHNHLVAIKKQRVKIYHQPTLKLNDTEMKKEKKKKFLDITLDPKLSFISHLEQLRITYKPTIQLLRIIVHTD